MLSGTDVKRYSAPNDRQYLLFPYQVSNEVASLYDFNLLKQQFPKAAEYLQRNKRVLENRERGKFNDSQWYRFGRNQNLGIQNRVKLCIPRLVQRIQVVFDSKGKYFLDNVDVGGLVFKPQFMHFDLRILLVLLNSKLLSWYFSFISAPFEAIGDLQIGNFLVKYQLCPIQDFTEDQMKIILNLSDQMLTTKKQLQQAKTESDKTYASA